MSDESPSISTSKKGGIRASITHLTSKLKELEGQINQPTTHDLAQRLKSRLECLDTDFKTYHFSLIDLIEDCRFSDGSLVEARALLNSASSTSFVSERLA